MTSTTDKPIPVTDLLDLHGRSAVVTGGAKGIGLAIVRRLHEAGADVIVADVDAAVDTVASELNGARAHSAKGIHADVSLELDAHRVVTAAVEQFGHINILVNNAGIYPAHTFLDMKAALFRRVLEVNLTGLFLCTQAAAERMIEQGRGGRIINITSIDALHPSMVGLSHYDASKHGAWGFTKNVALELAPHDIWVNAIAPGGIVTPGVGDMDPATLAAFERMLPMRRMGTPDEIARATLFLASEMSSYMTGSQIVVDGGKLLT
jgi:2-dehydro-3-deoxy-D-gluconate 5-dehydrogenase